VDRVVAIGVSGIVVIGAAILFAVTGRPELAGAPRENSVGQAAVAQSAPTDLPDVDTMIGRLAERLKANPGDAEGWRMLGWSNFQTQQYREAADAYQHALSIEPRNAGFQSALGEARLMADGGRVGPEALAIMRKALALDPRDERAQFYIGLSRSQNQDAKGALDVWLAALGRSPAGSEWNAQFRDHAVSLAREKGIDIAARLPPAPPSTPPQFEAGSFAPSADGVAQVRALAPSDQEAAIAGMVEGLDQKLVANPRDADGWKRLMRARMVLGQSDRARSALDRALAAYADDASVQREIRAAATELGVPAR
jgi:cytochrome c-type biogenesis protein CcmH